MFLYINNLKTIMKIQVISDLHLNSNKIPPIVKKTDSDVIVLAGDISNGFKLESAYAKRLFRTHHKTIIVINGNHSFHDTNLYEEQKKWRNARIPGVKYLDHTTGFILDGVNFLGGTLWVDYTDKQNCWVYKSKNNKDFDSIKVSKLGLFTPDISSHQHLLLKDHIHHNISPDHKNVIITHYPPSYQSFKGDHNEINGSCHFATDLEEFISSHDIKAWIHGHSHHSLDYSIGSTRVVCNPYGNEGGHKKAGLNKDYKSGFVIEV